MARAQKFTSTITAEQPVVSRGAQKEQDMSLHEDDIRQILKLIDESNFAEMDLKSGDLHLKVSKHLCAGAPPSASLPSQAEERPLAAPAPPAATPPAPAAAAPPMDSTESQGLLPIHAPTLGIFYRSPKPGAPPFVQEGDLIQDKRHGVHHRGDEAVQSHQGRPAGAGGQGVRRERGHGGAQPAPFPDPARGQLGRPA